MSEITVENLSVFYNGFCALSKVNFRATKGEFVSIVGLSGSGKTTLLNALAGFIPNLGQITITGKVGVVFQDYTVFPWLTVSQNIAFGLNNIDLPLKDEIVQYHLKLIGLEADKNKYPAELSGGQVQRVGIARALAPNPDVILMDEPYGALDRYTRDKMQEWLLGIWATTQKTIIFVTHDIEEACFLSDRVVVIYDKGISREFEVPFPRPRAEEVKYLLEFLKLKKQILVSMLGESNE